MKIEDAFGAALRERRESLKLSQETLALIADVDRTYISLLERGKRQPSLGTIIRLSAALELTPSALVEKVECILAKGDTL